jgi:hypothetical protein
MEEKRENLFDSNQKTHCLPTLLDGELGWKKERNDIKSERERERERGAGMGVFFFFFFFLMVKRLDWKDYTHVLIFLGIKHKYVFSLYILKMKKPKH